MELHLSNYVGLGTSSFNMYSLSFPAGIVPVGGHDKQESFMNFASLTELEIKLATQA